MHNRFNIKHFAVFEYFLSENRRSLYYITKGQNFCKKGDEALNCRAIRTKSIVASQEYLQVCEAMERKDLFYICIPFEIIEKQGIVISISAKTKEEFNEINEKLNGFKNYLHISKPALETKILLEELKTQSLKDRLTGAYNRRYLDDFVQKQIPQALRANIPYGVLMVDIDYFKMVNDKYGHDAGDMIIKELIKTIDEIIRDSDIIVRFGGEEFLVLLYNCDKENAYKIAEKIRIAFKSRTFNYGGEKFNKTISIGVSSFLVDSKQFWQVVKYADIALYEAKNSGRNKVVVFDEKKFDKLEDY